MRQTNQTVYTLYAAVVLLCCVPRYGVAQAGPPSTANPQLTAAAPADPRKAVLADTDHLLQLARELKATVDKTRRDELSLQVIREADEIEKLARSVKARIH